jgi:peptide deformylase
MYEHQGVGLAANQVDLPYRLFVINPEGTPEEKDAEMVFINPVLSGAKGSEEEEEGCLSIPNVFGPVTRSETIQVQAYNLEGEEIVGEISGLAARVVQHEIDHLNGTLFIDRLTPTAKMAVNEALEDFEIEFRSKREAGTLPDDASIAARLAELEKLWT